MSVQETSIQETNIQERVHPVRLKDLFLGFPRSLVSPHTFEKFVRFTQDLDSVGRLAPDAETPLIDETTLTAILREFIDRETADRLVQYLAALPGSAFRSREVATPPPDEVSWFELGKHVVVFDTSPEATFDKLRFPLRPKCQDVVRAVQQQFPSLEMEMLSPTVLPPRVEQLLQASEQFRWVLREIARQLGWWAAVVAVLLVPPTILTRPDANKGMDEALAGSAFPLLMYLLAAAVGGWTLTVVGSWILVPTGTATHEPP